jgi:glutaredoxin 3
MARVEIYSTMFCPYCARARSLLDKKGVDYIDIDVMADTAKRDEMLERSGGRQTVPQIFIDGEHIGGSLHSTFVGTGRCPQHHRRERSHPPRARRRRRFHHDARGERHDGAEAAPAPGKGARRSRPCDARCLP